MKGRYIWLICEDCGKERRVNFQYGKPMARRCKRCANRMEHNPNWGGGRKIRRGYVEVKLHPKDFFYSMVSLSGYVSEHRLVMAQHLGRCLQSWELVHHKNGIKDDNRLSNLELTTRGSHNIEHSKGYWDGYQQGLIDGRKAQIKESEGSP